MIEFLGYVALAAIVAAVGYYIYLMVIKYNEGKL